MKGAYVTTDLPRVALQTILRCTIMFNVDTLCIMCHCEGYVIMLPLKVSHHSIVNMML